MPSVCAPAPAAKEQPTAIVPRYLRPREAAAYLGLTQKQLEHYRVRGGGPKFLKLSKRVVTYDRLDLDEWVSRFRVGNTCEGHELLRALRKGVARE